MVGLSETGLGQPFLMQEVDMSAFDPATALETLAT
ncbi:conjugal transfer protein TraR, partial [Pseudomonas aeruginosa]